MTLAEAIEAVIKANKRRLAAVKLQTQYGDSPDVVIELASACQKLNDALDDLTRTWNRHES